MSIATTPAAPIDVGPYLRRVASASLVNTGVSALATAMLLPIVIRRVGMDVYGVWAVLGIFIGIASALDFGIWKALVYLLPKRQHSAGELFTSAALLSVATSAAFLIVMITLLAFNVPLFGAAIARQPGLTWWLGIGGALLVMTSMVTNLVRGVMEARYQGHLVNFGYALLTALLYGVATIVSHVTLDPRALIAGSVSVYVVLSMAHLLYLRSASTRAEFLGRPSRGASQALLRYGSRSFAADLPSIALGPTVLYIFVLLAANSAQFGIFEIALKISTLAATALGALSSPFFALVAAATEDRSEQMRAAINRQLIVTTSLALAGWATFLVVGKQILSLVFETSGDALYRATLIVLAGAALVAALEPIARMEMGLGRLRRLLSVRVIALSVTLLGVVVLQGLPPLDRFAIACCLGFAANACGLLQLARLESWGRELPKADAALDGV
jgi:O-antigen/teichoic acid export membrane protein